MDIRDIRRCKQNDSLFLLHMIFYSMFLKASSFDATHIKPSFMTLVFMKIIFYSQQILEKHICMAHLHLVKLTFKSGCLLPPPSPNLLHLLHLLVGRPGYNGGLRLANELWIGVHSFTFRQKIVLQTVANSTNKNTRRALVIAGVFSS